MADPNIPVTRLRLQIPRGLRAEDVLSKIEISFETIEASGEELTEDIASRCCQDCIVAFGIRPNVIIT